MIHKKNAQLSFEFILLFSLMMLIFIVVGTILITGLENSRQMESQAGYIAKDIKSSAIIASLSESNFESRVFIPQSIAGKNIFVDIHKLVVVKERNSGQDFKIIAKEFLPLIDSGGVPLENLNNVTIIIRKNGNSISILLSNE
jgi:hypothetical protein